MHRTFAPLLLLCSICLHSPLTALAVTITYSPVGNPGNAADPADGDDDTAGIQNFGAVPYAYNIGKYGVTAGQYVEFLNAKDANGANPLRLYNSNMSNATYGGINFTFGNANGSKYSVISGRGNHPANYVNWYDSIRFANWLNNGQGIGDTETGSYTLGSLGADGKPTGGLSITRNPGANVFLPSENEWYKAAYYNFDANSYFQYPTRSNTTPNATGPTAVPNSANYGNAVANLTDAGAYTGTTSPYGAFDMGGNVFQWNEALIGGSFRGLHGGSFATDSPGLLSTLRNNVLPSAESYQFGFRVASIPEPSTLVLAVVACGLMWVLRKRAKWAFERRPRMTSRVGRFSLTLN